MKIEKGCFIVMRKAGSSLSQMTDDTNDVYDWVSCIAAVPEAVKASSWCELAAVDDVYLGDGFTLAIVDVERGTRNVSAQQWMYKCLFLFLHFQITKYIIEKRDKSSRKLNI